MEEGYDIEGFVLEGASITKSQKEQDGIDTKRNIVLMFVQSCSVVSLLFGSNLETDKCFEVELEEGALKRASLTGLAPFSIPNDVRAAVFSNGASYYFSRKQSRSRKFVDT